MLFVFNDTATTEIYTLSLHGALPICRRSARGLRLLRRRLHQAQSRPARGGSAGDRPAVRSDRRERVRVHVGGRRDRKSTRLNSSHANISYAVFCLKKKYPILPFLPSP